MENNNINDLIEEGKKHLSELQQQIDKLAETAGKAAGIGADELAKKADEIIKEAAVHVEAAKTLIESKTKEVVGSEEFKNFEAEGRKTLDEAGIKIDELAKQASDAALKLGEKLNDIFGKKP